MSEIKTTLSEAYTDPVFFLKFFLSHWFPDKIPWFHRGIIAIILRRVDFLEKYGEIDKIIKYFVYRADPWDEKSPAIPMFSYVNGKLTLRVTRHTLIMVPRGFSKTTLMNGLNLYMLLFREKQFFVYLSESGPHAEEQLGNLKKQIQENELIKFYFGDLKPRHSDPARWTSDFFQTQYEEDGERKTGASVLGKGRGGQIRGKNIDGIRPQVIVCDDVEDLESVSTPEQREKAKKWLYRDVLPALPRRDRSAYLVMLATLLHADALAVTVSRDPRFNTVVFGALLDNGDPLWSEHMDKEEIERERSAAAQIGNLSGFYMELFNKIRADETAKFRQDMFYYLPVIDHTKLQKALMIDPAISSKPGASHCAFAAVGMDLKTGKHQVLDIRGAVGMAPRLQIDTYFEMSKLWKVQLHGVESIAYQQVLVHLLREEMFRKQHYFEIMEVKHAPDQKKEQRILGILQPRYANGYIYHQRRFPQLESALLDFPNGQMDYPDVVAMAIALLDPYAAAAADPTTDLGTDEYEELFEEEFCHAP